MGPSNLDTIDPPQDIKMFKYRELVGSLQYLNTCTHPEITYPLKIASKFLTGWGHKQVQWTRKILRYLRRPQSNSIIYDGKSSKLVGYTDASHIGCPDTRRSTSGYVIMLGNDCIDWGAKFQNYVSFSTFESELISLDLLCRRMRRVRWIVEALGSPIQGPITLFCDSQSVIDACHNPVRSTKSQHIHAKYFRIKDYLKNNEYILKKVSSAEQRADLLVALKGTTTFNHLHTLVKGEQPPSDNDEK